MRVTRIGPLRPRPAKYTPRAYPSIMHQAMSDKALQEYCQTGILPAGVRPSRCAQPNCGETSRFQRHSSYSRKCVYRQDVGWLPVMWVQRFLCATCDKVFTFFLPFVYKWQRAEHILQQAVAMDQPHPREEIAAAFSVRTLARWKQKWRTWSALHLQAILTWLLTWYSVVSVDVAVKHTRIPLNYLHALLAQLPGNVPATVAVVSACRFGGGPPGTIPHMLSIAFPQADLL